MPTALRGSPVQIVDSAGNIISAFDVPALAGTIGVLPVDLRGKVTTPGDTPILATTAGRLLAAIGPQELEGSVTTNGNTVYPMGSADFPQPIAAAPALYVTNYQTSGNNVVRNQRGLDGTIGQTFFPYKSVAITANGSTALWTPQSGKKFRLVRYAIEVTSNASLAAGAVLTIDLLDSAATFGQTHSVWVPTATVTAGQAPLLTTPWIDLGNGGLSSTANNVLNGNLSAALANGVCRILVCVLEE